MPRRDEEHFPCFYTFYFLLDIYILINIPSYYENFKSSRLQSWDLCCCFFFCPWSIFCLWFLGKYPLRALQWIKCSKLPITWTRSNFPTLKNCKKKKRNTMHIFPSSSWTNFCFPWQTIHLFLLSTWHHPAFISHFSTQKSVFKKLCFWWLQPKKRWFSNNLYLVKWVVLSHSYLSCILLWH